MDLSYFSKEAVISVGILVVTIILASLTKRLLSRFIKKSSSDMQSELTTYKFLKNTIPFIVYIIGIGIAIYQVPDLRTTANSLLAGAGILALAVGFASQQALANVVAGVFIVLFKPFRVNDRVTLQNTLSGVIEDITLRHTVIRNFENRRIIIPNSIVSNEIIVNADLTDKKVCKWIEIGISYDSDIDLARAIMQEEVLAHPLFLDNRSEEDQQSDEPAVRVRVILLGEYSVTLRAWAWARDNADAFSMGCDLYESIKKRFDQSGIEIPFPYRTVVMKNTRKPLNSDVA